MAYRSAATVAAEQAIAGTIYRTTLQTGRSLVEAAAGANSSTSRQVLALAEVFRRGIAPSERQRAHERMGRRAQQAVLNSYAQTVGGRKAASRYPYRKNVRGKNHRYAGGALKRALAADDFYVATPDGLLFVNESRLNKEARHWMRLNAGAGAVGRGSRRRFQVHWSNLVVGEFGADMEARPAFTMPRGYWFNREGGHTVPAGANPPGSDEFYPMGTGPDRGGKTTRGAEGRVPVGGGRGRNRLTKRGTPTKGIEARNFLDAGYRRLAHDLPDTYQRLYQQLWEKGVVGPQTKNTVRVSGTRPGRRISSSVRTFTNY